MAKNLGLAKFVESNTHLEYDYNIVLFLFVPVNHICAEVGVSPGKTARVLVAKPGLDGHDRGAKVVAHSLKDAGFEVIYTGLHQTVEAIIETAIQEDVDVIGLSIMSGAHVPICRKIFDLLHDKGVDEVIVLVGGVIPSRDIPTLKDMGVAEVFPGGSDIDAPATFIRARLGLSHS